MKRTIIIGSILAVFLMLMIPNISAVEYNTVKEHLPSFTIERNEFSPFVIFNLIFNIIGVIFNIASMLFTDGFDMQHFIFMIGHIILTILWTNIE